MTEASSGARVADVLGGGGGAYGVFLSVQAVGGILGSAQAATALMGTALAGVLGG
ncbi:hypothetical protein ACTMTI_17575 [Nonomuraea sp. H19]|uniref:hypothetical protein n=1 Tax=Nonomuraea sp. H19 TaxID=3452206 RepID=UPI003F894728